MKRYIKSSSEEESARLALAYKTNDPDVFKKLAEDDHWMVRSTVAERATDLEILAKLAHDKVDNVRMSVADNPATDPEILAKLASDRCWWVRIKVASHIQDPQILEELAKDGETGVRRWVITNKNTPDSVILDLINDLEDKVRNCAIEEAKNRGLKLPKSAVKKRTSWPSSDMWNEIESDEQFEDMWSEYLAGPEDKVNKSLNIFAEPSIQGGWGSMFLFDTTNTYEAVTIDFSDWCDAEARMAAESSSASEYKSAYRKYVKNLIKDRELAE